jgi:hypothetical protein
VYPRAASQLGKQNAGELLFQVEAAALRVYVKHPDPEALTAFVDVQTGVPAVVGLVADTGHRGAKAEGLDTGVADPWANVKGDGAVVT